MGAFKKILFGAALAAAASASLGTLAGCTRDKTGEAYGLVHGGGYVGYSKITVEGDKVKDLTLTEVCLPTYVKAGEGVADGDKVGNYYKTVSYANVTLVYSADDGDYKVGGMAFKTYLKDEANAKAYYQAVVSNSVKVTVGGAQKTDILNYDSLSKEANGYWSTDLNGKLGWKENRDKTVAYVKANGVGKLESLEKDAESGVWKDANGVSTGATWVDMNTDKQDTNSYVQLILKAYNAVS